MCGSQGLLLIEEVNRRWKPLGVFLKRFSIDGFWLCLDLYLNSDTRGFISSIMLKASHFSAFSYISMYPLQRLLAFHSYTKLETARCSNSLLNLTQKTCSVHTWISIASAIGRGIPQGGASFQSPKRTSLDTKTLVFTFLK